MPWEVCVNRHSRKWLRRLFWLCRNRRPRKRALLWREQPPRPSRLGFNQPVRTRLQNQQWQPTVPVSSRHRQRSRHQAKEILQESNLASPIGLLRHQPQFHERHLLVASPPHPRLVLICCPNWTAGYRQKTLTAPGYCWHDLKAHFQETQKLRTLGERLRVDAGKQQSLALMWMEKAWAAQIAGRYVTPREDNVLVYCNLALEADPGNQRAADLKKEIVKRAVAQADEWIQRGKFDAARLHYASMDYLASGDAAFPYPRAANANWTSLSSQPIQSSMTIGLVAVREC